MTQNQPALTTRTTAQTAGAMDGIDAGIRMLRSTALIMALSVSAVSLAAAAKAAQPFAISVDGVPVAGSEVPDAPAPAEEPLDVQVKFDGLGVKPLLNVSAMPLRRSFAPGEEITFLARTNYPDWIERKELRIYRGDAKKGDWPIAVLGFGGADHIAWTMPEDGPGSYTYVLRAYDGTGAFDETQPLELIRSADALATHAADDAVAPGMNEDRTAIRNISVYGGAVTVFGRNIPEGHRVDAFGEAVPLDPDGSFLAQRILPPGDHAVAVTVTGEDGKGLSFDRNVNIPSTEWFYVAMADLTAGYRTGSKGIEAVRDGEFDRVYTKGRLAFYLKGKIQGRYLLTASGDTREGKFRDMFRGADGKDPRDLLSRIDPDAYYPVYGDDSQAVMDAPTRGKLYVRLERGESHVMWGTFKADVTGSGFLRNDRELYGAKLAYRPDAVTEFGARKTDVTAYVSEPGTLPGRDLLRGTGGSAYFLKYQDLTRGSETVSVEIHDRVTGRILERRTLAFDQDYAINYAQGLVILRKPLASTSQRGEAVETGGNPQYLVVNYEFTPAAGKVDGYTYGGRGQQWLGDHLRIAVTGMTEKTGAADQKLAGADILVRKSDKTYLEAEVAQSQGPGFTTNYSQDGGLGILDLPSAGRDSHTARAWRLRAVGDLGELTSDEFRGRVEAYTESYGAHFASRDYNTERAERRYGANASIDIGESSHLNMRYDERRVEGEGNAAEAAVETELALGGNWSITPGLAYSSAGSLSSSTDDKGDRLDAGTRVTYAWSESREIYVRGQTTVMRNGKRDRNDRAGIGGKMPVTDKVSLEGEVSYGSAGFGALAAIDYSPTVDDHYYLGYRLVPDAATAGSSLGGLDEAQGVIVAGSKRKLSDELSAFGEGRSTPFGGHQSLLQAYGVTYTPDTRWTLTGGIESGLIFGDSTIDGATDIERTAVSARAGFRDGEKFSATLGGEYRNDHAKDGSSDVDSYLLTSGLRIALSDDWRILAGFDATLTDATDSKRDGDYAEATLGFAYRPVDNDRLNALFKYSYLYDLPGADQVTATGSTDGPQQETHILSADASYDVTPQLTLGAKYGFRLGKTRDRGGAGDWSDAMAQLGILRADIHVVHKWDIMLEGRALWTGHGGTIDYGFVAGVFRQLSDNVKVGIGYNFGRFSDDLRDQTFDDQGVFINVLGTL